VAAIIRKLGLPPEAVAKFAGISPEEAHNLSRPYPGADNVVDILKRKLRRAKVELVRILVDSIVRAAERSDREALDWIANHTGKPVSKTNGKWTTGKRMSEKSRK
jgi:hypothetical protein